MATAAVTRPTPAEQWQRALERALEEALDVLVEPISGEAFVESATHPGTLYAVSATSCTCAAGSQGLPCKHRACYLAQLGKLPTEALPAVVDLPVIDCPDCCGCGVQHFRTFEERCDVCGGRGVVAA